MAPAVRTQSQSSSATAMENRQSGEDDVESSNVRETWRTLIKDQNRKHKKSGGFQSMGLSHAVLQGVIKRGYKVPTPIQRKCIPLLLEGRDVVAMSRTGSGKTAAFMIPLLERLRAHDASRAPRALILSPTRELALQTYKFFRELGQLTHLKAMVILGGDRIEDQFAALHQKPDVLIATPGRFTHLLIEMSMKLDFVEYVVIDEADRLFELGFATQVNEIFRRLPESRQTSLFSATLPKAVVEFAKYGLAAPTLVRLDVDSKLPVQLSLAFLACRESDKMAILMYLIRHYILSDNVANADKKAIIFFATKHHIDYAREVLLAADIEHAYIYSSLDAVARKINMEKFRQPHTRQDQAPCNILLVTDVAARGVDIPFLDVVINMHFPPKSKMFVHRVGRVARAGRSGTAISLVAPDEFAFLMDFHLFLGRPLHLCPIDTRSGNIAWPTAGDGAVGSVPQSAIDAEDEILRNLTSNSTDIMNALQVSERAYGKYIRTRPQASAESVKRIKNELVRAAIGVHPIFKQNDADFSLRNEADEKTEGSTAASVDIAQQHQQFLQGIKTYRSRATIFELKGQIKQNAGAFNVMRQMREKAGGAIAKYRAKLSLQQQRQQTDMAASSTSTLNETVDADEQPGVQIFSSVIASKAGNNDSSTPFQRRPAKAKRQLEKQQRPQPFINYKPNDYHTEQGLEIDRQTFAREAESVGVDMLADEGDELVRQQRNSTKRAQLQWDRRNMKFTTAGNNTGSKTDGDKKQMKKIKTDSGTWISASYKTGIYEKWKKSNKLDSVGGSAAAQNTVSFDNDDADAGADDDNSRKFSSTQPNQHHFDMLGRGRKKFAAGVMVRSKFTGDKNSVVKNEVRNADQVAKERRQKAKVKSLQNKRKYANEQRRVKAGKKQAQSGRGGGGGGGGAKSGGRSSNKGGGKKRH